jgi:hypothetical protein
MISWVTVVRNLEWGSTMLHGYLCENDSTTEDKMMLLAPMAENLFETFPSFQSMISGFMPSPCSVHCLSVLKAIGMVGCTNFSVTSVASISNDLLSWTKLTPELDAKDSQIRKTASRKWAVEPNNASSVDRNTKLISQPCAAKFV